VPVVLELKGAAAQLLEELNRRLLLLQMARNGPYPLPEQLLQSLKRMSGHLTAAVWISSRGPIKHSPPVPFSNFTGRWLSGKPRPRSSELVASGPAPMSASGGSGSLTHDSQSKCSVAGEFKYPFVYSPIRPHSRVGNSF